MNMRNTSLIIATLTLFTMVPVLSNTLFMGSIQFPDSIKTVPDMRIYYAGHKITSAVNATTKENTFNICENQNCSTFYLIITDNIDLETPKGSNTIRYLVNKHNAYKFYAIRLIKKDKYEYEWVIKEIPLIGNRIPDNAIIVYYNPEYIETVKIENSIRLLKIHMKQNIVELAGSHEQLQEESERILCSAINLDSIHTKIEPTTKQFCEKLVVASL